MMKKVTLTAYAILVVTEKCLCIHFLELPGFESDLSHEHQGFKNPPKPDLDTGGAHRPQYKKSGDYKHFRRMQAKFPKKLDQNHDAEMKLKILRHENIPLEPQEGISANEHDIINKKIRAINENMELKNIDSALAAQAGPQYVNSPLKRQVISVNGGEGKHWRNTQVPIKENIESQNNNAAAVQTHHQNRYPPLKQELTHAHSDERKQWQNTEIPKAEDNMNSQNIGKAVTVYTERQNRYPLLKHDVKMFPNVDNKLWGTTRVSVVRENMETQNIDGEVVKAHHQSRNPPLNHNVREDMEASNIDSELQTERLTGFSHSKQKVRQNVEHNNYNARIPMDHQNRYPLLKQKVIGYKDSHNTDAGTPTDDHNRYSPSKQNVRENLEPEDIDTAEIVQTQHQREYPPLKQKLREEVEPPVVQTEHQRGYPYLREKDRENMEFNIDDAKVQTDRQNIYPPLKQKEPTDYYIERRHWLVARKDGDSANIPPINKDDKDATLKAKIHMLVNQTVRDTEEKVKSIQDIKDVHKEKAPYKIGYVVSMVKKSRDVLNELFNVAVKHRDEWKALEQLKIFELIVHTNVDTTNLVRQLVEIHVQHLNSTSSGGEETTEATGGGRRVVLI